MLCILDRENLLQLDGTIEQKMFEEQIISGIYQMNRSPQYIWTEALECIPSIEVTCFNAVTMFDCLKDVYDRESAAGRLKVSMNF